MRFMSRFQKLPYYPHAQINIPATLLAEKLTGLLPGNLNHVYFCNSGSEANETAIKMARQYGRQKISRRESLQDYQSLSRVSRLHVWSDVRNGSNPSSQSV